MLPCHGNCPSSILGSVVNHNPLWLNCSPYFIMILMTNRTAFDSIKESFDIEELRDIVEHGCAHVAPTNFTYYNETVEFFDKYQDEIESSCDTEDLNYCWNNNPTFIDGYKNDVVWYYIEQTAIQLIEQYEDITCQELSDLSNTEWGKSHLEVVTL